MLTRSACRGARNIYEGHKIFRSVDELSPAASKGMELLLFLHVLRPVAIGWSFTMIMSHAAGVGFSDAGLILLLCGIGAAYSLEPVSGAVEERHRGVAIPGEAQIRCVTGPGIGSSPRAILNLP